MEVDPNDPNSMIITGLTVGVPDATTTIASVDRASLESAAYANNDLQINLKDATSFVVASIAK